MHFALVSFLSVSSVDSLECQLILSNQDYMSVFVHLFSAILRLCVLLNYF